MALERTGIHRGIAFVVKVNAEAGRRMRWSASTENDLIETGVTSYGIEAAFKAGLDAAEVAIDIADGKKATARPAAANTEWAAYRSTLDVLKDAITAWAADSSDDNLAEMETAQRVVDAKAKIFYRSAGKSK